MQGDDPTWHAFTLINVSCSLKEAGANGAPNTTDVEHTVGIAVEPNRDPVPHGH
jgi:hypothetical protein